MTAHASPGALSQLSRFKHREHYCVSSLRTGLSGVTPRVTPRATWPGSNGRSESGNVRACARACQPLCAYEGERQCSAHPKAPLKREVDITASCARRRRLLLRTCRSVLRWWCTGAQVQVVGLGGGQMAWGMGASCRAAGRSLLIGLGLTLNVC